ncbi:MAG: magnesium transporter CorA family protein [Chloroflexi bacterium]|nr:magnesium transporter CorA family protein [Chloroflexota bacterium]
MSDDRARSEGRAGSAAAGRSLGPKAGAQAIEPPIGVIRVAALLDGTSREWTGSEALQALRDGLLGYARGMPAATVWIDLAAPSAAEVAEVAALLGLHPLIAEDIVEGNQRPKIEATDGVIHLVLFALELEDGIRTHEIDLVLGERFLLSAHPRGWDPRLSTHFRSGLEPILRDGPDHLLWALADTIVDAYFPFADQMEDAIDALQDRVMERTDRETLTEVFGLKRDLIDVRRAVSPVREVLNQLTNRDLALIDGTELLFFRDVYDHVIRITDELDNDRELVAATLDVYLSQVNNNLSAIMKRLTGVTVLLAGIGAIAGIFGMSEAGLAFSGGEATGFWVVAIATVTVSAIAALVLRRLDWI